MTVGSTATPAPRRPSAGRSASGLAALGLLCGAVLTGCVPAPPALSEVWPAVRHGVDEARSVRVSGDVEQDGRRFEVELAGELDDSSYAGRLTEEHGTVEVIADADTTYIRPDAQFAAQRGGTAFKDVDPSLWIALPSRHGGAFSMATFYEGFVSALPAADAFDGEQPAAQTLRLDGERVFKYSDVDAGDSQVSLYINQEDELVRLQVQRDQAGEGPSGSIDFRDWNDVPAAQAPPQDLVYQRPGF